MIQIPGHTGQQVKGKNNSNKLSSVHNSQNVKITYLDRKTERVGAR